MIKPSGFMRLTFTKMPFADHGGLVAGVFQMLCNVGHPVVNLVVESADGIDVVVGARQDGCATRGTYRVGYVAMVEQHSLPGETIDVWSLVDASAIRANRLGSMVVRHDEEDVGPSALGRCWRVTDHLAMGGVIR